MKKNAEDCLKRILKHEGGYVNHPDDPGGATNRGVTLRTLRDLGMDLDGDGDIDIADLKALSEDDAIKIFKRFYWDAVKADMLPSGIDYTVADFAVNSGPSRAAKYLQIALGVKVDGVVGPNTLAAAKATIPETVIARVNSDRKQFLQGLKHWKTFGLGWTRRVDSVHAHSLVLAGNKNRKVGNGGGQYVWLQWIIDLIKGLFK